MWPLPLCIEEARGCVCGDQHSGACACVPPLCVEAFGVLTFVPCELARLSVKAPESMLMLWLNGRPTKSGVATDTEQVQGAACDPGSFEHPHTVPLAFSSGIPRAGEAAERLKAEGCSGLDGRGAKLCCGEDAEAEGCFTPPPMPAQACMGECAGLGGTMYPAEAAADE